MRAIGAAVIRLAQNPHPPEAFHRGDYHRLRVGLSRVGEPESVAVGDSHGAVCLKSSRRLRAHSSASVSRLR